MPKKKKKDKEKKSLAVSNMPEQLEHDENIGIVIEAHDKSVDMHYETCTKCETFDAVAHDFISKHADLLLFLVILSLYVHEART